MIDLLSLWEFFHQGRITSPPKLRWYARLYMWGRAVEFTHFLSRMKCFKIAFEVLMPSICRFARIDITLQ